MGIYTFLGKNIFTIQASTGHAKATGCNKGKEEEGVINSLYDINLVTNLGGGSLVGGKLDKGFVLETFSRRSI